MSAFEDFHFKMGYSSVRAAQLAKIADYSQARIESAVYSPEKFQDNYNHPPLKRPLT